MIVPVGPYLIFTVTVAFALEPDVAFVGMVMVVVAPHVSEYVPALAVLEIMGRVLDHAFPVMFFTVPLDFRLYEVRGPLTV